MKVMNAATRGIFFSVLCLLLLPGCTRAYLSGTSPSETAQPVPIASPVAAIPVGETLKYQISWWGAPVATAVLTSQLIDNNQVQLTFEGRSNWSLDLIYPVRAKLTSIVDTATLQPRQFQGYLKRRWHVHESTVHFDHQAGVAVHHLKEGEPVRVPITSKTQDGISLIYHVRTLPVRLGETLPFQITADGKNWDITTQVVRAQIVSIGNLGKWPAIEGEGELAYPVPFFHGARANVWFSADADRIPLLARIKSRIGPVTAVLTERTLSRNTGD